MWVHSSAKQQRDETARDERIQRTLAALAELNERLAGPRARITTRVGVDDAATEIIDTGSAEQYVTFTNTETTEAPTLGGESAGDGLALNLACPGDVGAVQAGWVCVAGAVSLAAAVHRDVDRAGQYWADLRELGLQLLEARVGWLGLVRHGSVPSESISTLGRMRNHGLMIAHTPSDPAERLELASQTLGALPIVCHFLDRMRLGVLLERHLPPPDARCRLEPARAIGLLVRNLCVSHEETFRQEKRGRPGNDTRYRKLTKTRFQVTATVDTDQVRHDAASDGCFPPITNDHQLTNTAVLIAHRYQPNLEKRHHQPKSVHDAAPVTLKNPHRIEALFACQFIALLCCCLIERELPAAMTREQITDLPLYHEHRSCTAPTAARVFDHLTPIQRHHLTRDRHTVQTFEPQLTPLQTQLLDLLAVPASAYTSQP